MENPTRRKRFQIHLSMSIALLLFNLPLIAAETPRIFPLWDGKETVESYAKRVDLPAMKSIDLGGGVGLDLVLIPAGQFIMGSAEPVQPSVTVAGAEWLIGLGGGAAVVLLLVLAIQCTQKRKLAFSLRWLLLMTIATGVCVGGIARRMLALKEAARYETELAQYKDLPANEKPTHSVTLTQPFYMDKYTVTQEQYTALMGNNPSYDKGAQLPVDWVSWVDASEFCQKLNSKLKDKAFNARLPTEAQWEYSCRAGTQTRFFSGDQENNLDAVGWYGANSGSTMHPVGQKSANAFGLYDMHGNVWQWCQDWYDKNGYLSSTEKDPAEPPSGAKRVLRGGTHLCYPEYCRSATRGNGTPDQPYGIVGFRIILAMNF